MRTIESRQDGEATDREAYGAAPECALALTPSVDDAAVGDPQHAHGGLLHGLVDGRSDLIGA